jgi:hypothetical protein
MIELAQLAFVLMLWGIIDTMFCALGSNSTKPANEHKPNQRTAIAAATVRNPSPISSDR